MFSALRHHLALVTTLALWHTPVWGNLNSSKSQFSADLQGGAQNLTLKTLHTCQIDVNRIVRLILQLPVFISICITPYVVYF